MGAVPAFALRAAGGASAWDCATQTPARTARALAILHAGETCCAKLRGAARAVEGNGTRRQASSSGAGIYDVATLAGWARRGIENVAAIERLAHAHVGGNRGTRIGRLKQYGPGATLVNLTHGPIPTAAQVATPPLCRAEEPGLALFPSAGFAGRPRPGSDACRTHRIRVELGVAHLC